MQLKTDWACMCRNSCKASGRIVRTKRRTAPKGQWKGILFTLPSLLGVAVFYGVPYLDVLVRSFMNNFKMEFCGFENYLEVVNNAAFRLAAKNTLRFEVCCIPLLLSISFLLAYIIRNLSWKQSAKSILLVPMAIPAASIAFIWKVIFEQRGFLNMLLGNMGIEGPDYLNSDYAFWVLVGTYLWKNMGFTVILWIAAMNSIPKELYEAAGLDGADEWKKLWCITLPNLKGMTFTILLLSVLNSFKVYREAYLAAGNYPDDSMYLLQHLFGNWYMGMKFDQMAAGSVLLGGVILGLVVWLMRSWEADKTGCLCRRRRRRNGG